MSDELSNGVSHMRDLAASAQTWIGMTPIWLMGEAILPGAKVGGTFKKGTRKLVNVAEELRDALMTSSYVWFYCAGALTSCSIFR